MSRKPFLLQNAPRLADYPNMSDWATALTEHIDGVTAGLKEIDAALGPSRLPYLVANLTPTRTLDCDTATLPEVADVLGSLITDLKTKGTLRGKAS